MFLTSKTEENLSAHSQVLWRTSLELIWVQAGNKLSLHKWKSFLPLVPFLPYWRFLLWRTLLGLPTLNKGLNSSFNLGFGRFGLWSDSPAKNHLEAFNKACKTYKAVALYQQPPNYCMVQDHMTI